MNTQNSGAPAPSRICEQVGHDKVHDHNFTYATNPPKVAWICRRCGYEGFDSGTSRPKVSAYDLEKEKWGK